MTTPSNPYNSGDSQGNGNGNENGNQGDQGFQQGSYQPYPGDQNGQFGQNNQFGQFDQNGNANGGNPGDWSAYPNAQVANNTGSNQDGFFAALFDFSFTRYVTPSVVKVLYILLMILAALVVLFGLVMLLAAVANDSSGIIALIIGLPLLAVGAIAWLAFYRVGLEVAVSIIRTAQSVQSIDERQARNDSIGG